MSIAVIDVDVHDDMVDHRQRVVKSDDGAWRIARASAATLTDASFQAGIDLVFVESPFSDRSGKHS